MIWNQSFTLQLRHIDYMNRTSIEFGREKLLPKKKHIIKIAQGWSILTSLRRVATYFKHLKNCTRASTCHFPVLIETSRVISSDPTPVRGDIPDCLIVDH